MSTAFQTYLASDESLVKKVKRDFPNANLVIDEELDFLDYLIPGIKNKKEVCTIRYAPDLKGQKSIRLPKTDKGWMPLISVDEKGQQRRYGITSIGMILVARLADFPDWAILADEYHEHKDEHGNYDMLKNRETMILDISRIYYKELDGRRLDQTDFISGFFICDVLKDNSNRKTD